VRDRVQPKASVVITPHPGRMVSPMQVQAIVHLVSSSVPYLAPEHVTVVDNLGKLMTESASELKLGLTAAQQQHKQQLEEVYRNRILQILSPMVGEANVRTQVNLTLDFTEIESTTEDFDTRGKGPRTRSEVLAEDNSSQPRPEGIPGALSNTPPAQPLATATAQVDNTPDNPAGQTQSQTQSDLQTRTSSRATRNYELDRSVRHVRNTRGEVSKVSVAVVVNERPATNAAADPNAPKSTPFTQEELDGMLRLVRGVISFDESRGDLVSVVPARFEPLALSPQDFLPWYLEDTVQTAIKSGLIALSFIVFLLIVVRPVMNGLFGQRNRASEELQAKALADGELTEEELRMIQIGEGESIEEIKARLKPKKSSISVDMLDTANTYDDKVALIRMLVAEDSGRVANVLKSMMKSGS
jgi:flagellar M-ring protein FliF